MDRSYSNKWAAISLFFIFLYGCNFLGFNNDGEVTLETDRDSYPFGSGAVFQMTVTNHYDHAIYYVCTGQIYLEELEEGAVIDKWLVHGFELRLNRIPLEADQSISTL